MSRLAERYQQEIIPLLQKEMGVVTSLAVPRLMKVVINRGIAKAAKDEELFQRAALDLAAIAGQKPLVRRAKKSIAEFKLGKGDPIGLKVTLRGKRMYDFLDKLFNIVLPRVRDFRGLSTAGFDGHGNYTLGLEEEMVFPEVEFRKTEKVRGLEISIVTNAKTDERAKRLLELLGMPFSAKGGIRVNQEGLVLSD